MSCRTATQTVQCSRDLVRNSAVLRSLQAATTGDLRLDLYQFREMHQLFQRRGKYYCQVKSAVCARTIWSSQMGSFHTLPGQRDLLKDYMLKLAKFRCCKTYRKLTDSGKTFFTSVSVLVFQYCSVTGNILIKHNFWRRISVIVCAATK